MSLIQADARNIPLRDGVVQCVVTSPPYFGLRDYGTAEWDGGDPGCKHVGRPKPRQDTTGSGVNKGRFAETRGTQEGKRAYSIPVREQCKCGARRIDRQIGLEETPADYVRALVGVFREVRRVMKDDGTLWLNLGDSYAGFWGAQSRGNITGEDKSRLQGTSPLSARQIQAAPKGTNTGSLKNTPGIKNKDLIGIPWEVALALRADGWYLRAFMPWLKRNGMPESSKDRPTTVVESLFLLTKSPDYFYDHKAVEKIGAVPAGIRAAKGSNVRSELKDVNARPPEYWEYTGTRLRRASDWFFESFQGLLGDEDGRPLAFIVNTLGFDEAHFAVMPEALAVPCVLAGSRPGDLCFDPFIGSGTLGVVADRHDRRWVGLDLTYQNISSTRTAQRGLRFSEAV